MVSLQNVYKTLQKRYKNGIKIVQPITLCNKFEVKKKYKTYKTCFGVIKVC